MAQIEGRGTILRNFDTLITLFIGGVVRSILRCNFVYRPEDCVNSLVLQWVGTAFIFCGSSLVAAISSKVIRSGDANGIIVVGSDGVDTSSGQLFRGCEFVSKSFRNFDSFSESIIWEE